MAATLEQFEPSANGAGKIGTNSLRWGEGHFVSIYLNGAAVAPVASPTFTGVPAAPTAAGGTSTTQIATTAFVQGAVADAKARANHTGTQLAATISDFDAAVSASTAGGKAHDANSDTKLANGTANEVTAAAIRAHLDDATKHRQINDAATSSTTLWSSSKIASELAGVGGGGALASLNTVGTAQIDNDAVTADKIATGAVGSAELAAAAVTGAKVEGGSATPGNVKYWGTNASGTFGFHSLALVADTSPQLGGTLDTNGKQVRESKGADVASASNLTLGNDGNYFDITGTTTITSIATKAVGTVVRLHFDAALTLTHHATDLILPGSVNITTAAGDEAEFVEYAVGDWRCTSYLRASGISGGISELVQDTSPQLGGVLDTNSFQVRESKGADVASASSLTLGNGGNYFVVTGTTTITSIGSKGIGTRVTLRFAGALVLTHHATDLILPGGANITTAAGDTATFIEYASGDWVCAGYTRASGEALVNLRGAGWRGVTSFSSSPAAFDSVNYDGWLYLLDTTTVPITFNISPGNTGNYFWVVVTSASNAGTITRTGGALLYSNGTNADVTMDTQKTYFVVYEGSNIWRVVSIN